MGKTSGPGKVQEDQAVADFLKMLDHPLKKDIAAVRKIILGASPDIREGIKWNAPSFRLADYFATFNLRAKDAVQLVFHRGAKVKAAKQIKLDDPLGLVKHLASDRCLVTLGAGPKIAAHRQALEKIVRDWISHL